MNEIISFGEWIKLRRKALDLSQEALGQLAGYSVATIRKIEADGQRPSRDLATKLAEHLRLPDEEHETFIKVARGLLRVSHLPPANLDTSIMVQRLVPSIPQRPPCPYPGMVSFSEYSSDLFFGRDAETQDMVARLHLYPFLALIGPSGSGKSSLVYAGLIPALRRSTLFGDGTWLVCTMRPGATPLVNLTEGVGCEGDDFAPAVSRLLQQHTHARLLLVVDQFEETFTVAGEQAESFQQRLQDLCRLPGCYVVITVRADFYADMMLSPLWATIQRHRAEVVPLDAAGLRLAITQPAQAVGVTVEPALVERLVASAASEPGVLPIVQETLRLLWDRSEQRILPLSAYHAMILPGANGGGSERSGLHVVLARRADATLNELPLEAQMIARRIFLRLVQFGVGRADTRRQQSIDALRSVGEESRQFDHTLRHLTERRLLTLSGAEGSARKVDIAHETLITGWPTLQLWLAERREAEQDRRRLEAKAAEWIRLGRGRNGLLDAIELAEAERWLESGDASELGYDEALPALVAVSRDVLEENERAEQAAQQQALAQAQALAETERRHVTAQARAIRSLRALVAVLSILILVGGGVIARPFWLRQRAIWLGPMIAISVPSSGATIGSDDATAANTSKPAHQVKLPPFEIDTHEVSNQQYCLCRSAGGCSNDPVYDKVRVCDATIADLPVTNVTLNQSNEYCTWIGRRLPTEMEWEWAARGVEQRRFPTGNEPPNLDQVNLGGKSAHKNAVWPVGSAAGDRTPDGVLDMTGNVQEWTVSLNLLYGNPEASTVYWPANPHGASDASLTPVIVRGGSWYTSSESADPTIRYPLLANQAYNYIGFRCLHGVSLSELSHVLGQ